jgi:hypothetical protein
MVRVESPLHVQQSGGVAAVGQGDLVVIVGAQEIGIAAGERSRRQGPGQVLRPSPVTGAIVFGSGLPGGDKLDQEVLWSQAEGYQDEDLPAVD